MEGLLAAGLVTSKLPVRERLQVASREALI